MLSDQAKSLAAEEVRNFFKDPNVAKQVVNHVLKKRPSSWGKRSNAPYYAEHYARDLAHHLDGMIEDKQDRVFMFKDFAPLKPASVYLRLNQSFLFLKENMNEDFKYTNLNTQINVLREKNCVRFTFKEQFRNVQTPLKSHAVMPMSQSFIWKDKIDTFLEDANDTKLHIDKLLLTKIQMEELIESLAGVKGIIYDINVHDIKIIKVNDPL